MRFSLFWPNTLPARVSGAPYSRLVQLRRALIAFAAVLAVVTVISALAGPGDDTNTASLPPVAPAPRASAAPPVTVAFRHPPGRTAPVRPVRNGAHVVVRVQAQVAGNVEIGGLGLVQPVTPGTPAVFDLLASRSGRFEVSLVSVAGERSRLGVLDVTD